MGKALSSKLFCPCDMSCFVLNNEAFPVSSVARTWVSGIFLGLSNSDIPYLKANSIVRNSCFWPGLGLPRPKAIVVIPKNQPLPKHLRKKTSKSAKHACHYATKERPVKITMYLGLDIIIKIKFTTIFDRCAILNVLNYLTKNFESS